MLYEDLINAPGTMARLEKLYELLVEYYRIKFNYASEGSRKEPLTSLNKLSFINPQDNINNFITSITPLLLDNNVKLSTFLKKSNIKRLKASDFYLDYISLTLNDKDDRGSIARIYSLELLDFININDEYYSDPDFIDFMKNTDNESILPVLKELQVIEDVSDGIIILKEYKSLVKELKLSDGDEFEEINHKSFTNLFLMVYGRNRVVNEDEILGMMEYYQHFNFLCGSDSVAKAFVTFKKNNYNLYSFFDILLYSYQKNYSKHGSLLFYSEGEVYDALKNNITTEEFINFYSENMPLEWTMELYLGDQKSESVDKSE